MGVDVCSIYLLEADRTHLVLAATVGLRPESVGTVRMELHEGLAGLVAEQLRPIEVPNVKRHPRFKHFAEAGEDPYYTFLGVPLIDRELLQGVLIVQTVEERSFSDDEITALLRAAGEISPIVAQVRERDQSIGPLQRRLWELARNLWWSWDASALDLFQDLDPVRWEELGRSPVALLSEMPLDVLDERIGDLALAHRINHTFRRMQEYRARFATWGRHQRRHPPAPTGRLLLGRVRHPRVAADLLRRARRAGGRPHQERLRPGRSARRGRPVLRPGLLSATSRRHGLAAGGLRRSGPGQAAARTRGRGRRHAGRAGDHHPHRNLARAGVAGGRRTADAPAARLGHRRQHAGGPRADRAALRRRRPRAHSAGAAARHRRAEGIARARHRAGRVPSERGT